MSEHGVVEQAIEDHIRGSEDGPLGEFDKYQETAYSTAWWENTGERPIDPLAYCAMKLAGEAGEVAEKIGKLYRDRGGKIDKEWTLELVKELGDVLWYLAVIARLVGVSLYQVARTNNKKLLSRFERGVIKGSGDNR